MSDFGEVKVEQFITSLIGLIPSLTIPSSAHQYKHHIHIVITHGGISYCPVSGLCMLSWPLFPPTVLDVPCHLPEVVNAQLNNSSLCACPIHQPDALVLIATTETKTTPFTVSIRLFLSYHKSLLHRSSMSPLIVQFIRCYSSPLHISVVRLSL